MWHWVTKVSVPIDITIIKTLTSFGDSHLTLATRFLHNHFMRSGPCKERAACIERSSREVSCAHGHGTDKVANMTEGTRPSHLRACADQ